MCSLELEAEDIAFPKSCFENSYGCIPDGQSYQMLYLLPLCLLDMCVWTLRASLMTACERVKSYIGEHPAALQSGQHRQEKDQNIYNCLNEQHTGRKHM